MKKTHIIGIVLAVLILAGGVAAFLWTGNAVRGAEAAQKTVYDQYRQLRANVEQSKLTVTEDGVVIGTYSLGELGVLNDTLAAADGCFSEQDRMEPERFQTLTTREKLDWAGQAHPQTPTVQVALTHLDVYAPMEDLVLVRRTEAKDAYVEFRNDRFQVYEEVPGTQLQVQNVQTAMGESLRGLTVSAQAPAAARFELTSCDCYLPPERTVENTFFDFDAMLNDRIEAMTVELDFHGETVAMTREQLKKVLSATPEGRVAVDEQALTELAAQWNETYHASSTPYLFDSYVDGVLPIEFVKVDYEVNQPALVELLKDELASLQSVELEVPWYCWRNGEAFAIEGTYVEVDIHNQVMTFFKDGEIVVTTDVVTGNTWGYPTPTGLYKVENKDTNCWLSGEDYNVHVDYWVGFIGYVIGIHDADWRTKFGGDNYVMNGSHGCVNTPKEAMVKIFENIEVGVPVLVHDQKDN